MQRHVPPTTPVWGTLIAVTLARIAFGYQVQTVASVAPDLIAQFSIAFAAVGTLMGLYLMPGIAAAIPLGFLGRRFGEFWVLAGGLALMVIGNLAAADASDPFGIGSGRVVAGTGAVALTVMQAKVTADRFDGNRFVLAMGLLVGAFPVGIGLAQVTQSRLSHAFGWQAAFVAGAVVAFAALLVFVTTWREADRQRVRSLRWPSRHECVLVVLSGLIWTAYNAGYFNFLGYMPSYLARHGHQAWEADVVIGIATWGNLPAILLGGALVSRVGPNLVFLFGTVLSTVSILGMYVADWPLVWGALFGTLASVHAGVIVARGTLSARPENRAVGMALFYSTYYLGGFFIPPLCGRVADLVGDPSGAFLCAGAISALAVPFYFLHAKASAHARAETVG
jgi:predicted MFS family arabinose efflux permease